MSNLRSVCVNFKKVLLEDYEKHDDILRCLDAYLGFLMEFCKEKYGQFTQWQIDDLRMATHNPKVDVGKTALETLWRWTRRGGKSQKLTALATFGSLMDLRVVWRATFTDQLGQASEWFNLNPFVSENRITSLNKIGIYGSPDINIAVLSEAKVASRGADWLIYDEGGWCFKDHKKNEFYVASRPMIGASEFKRITHASTPAKMTAFHDAAMFLEKEEAKLDTQFQSWHPWSHTTWISKEWVEQERLLHYDCPWYVDQNYEALWVVYGGAVFTNVIEEGDPNYPQYPIGYLEAYKNKYGAANWGVDFNGEDVQHYRVGIVYDENFVLILEETKFLDLWELSKLEGSTEVEDGLFNTQFTEQTKRMGLPLIYKAWNEAEKQERVAQLCNRKIVVNKRECPTTWKNLLEAGYDKNSRLPKLEKRTDQHGLDALLHALHTSTGKIYVPSRRGSNKSPLLGGTRRYNPLNYL